jgi:hypothetical protein
MTGEFEARPKGFEPLTSGLESADAQSAGDSRALQPVEPFKLERRTKSNGPNEKQRFAEILLLPCYRPPRSGRGEE